MSNETHRTCPSDLVVDRYLADELAHEERCQLEAHCAACAACQTLVDQRRAAAARFIEHGDPAASATDLLRRLDARRRVPRAATPHPSERRRRRVVWVAGTGAAAALAATLLVLLRISPPQSLPDDAPDGPLRVKGQQFSIQGYVKRGAEVVLLASGDIVYPGDTLRFSYNASRRGHLAIVGVDARQAVTLYAPSGNKRALPAPAGARRLVPGATLLDETLGPEQFVAVLCPESFSLRPIEQQARGLAQALRRRASVAPLLPDRRCQVAQLTLDKRRPGGSGPRGQQ